MRFPLSRRLGYHGWTFQLLGQLAAHPLRVGLPVKAGQDNECPEGTAGCGCAGGGGAGPQRRRPALEGGGREGRPAVPVWFLVVGRAGAPVWGCRAARCLAGCPLAWCEGLAWRVGYNWAIEFPCD